MSERILCEYTQDIDCHLLIVFGAIHGNEPAGVLALQRLQEMLVEEKKKNPKFLFYGKIIGILGNSRAFEQQKRFITKDLNRQWQDENVKRILAEKEENLTSEKLEIKEIVTLVNQIIDQYQPVRIVVLDIHSTSAEGGIFAIPSETEKSIATGKAMHVPVVNKMLKGLNGTTLHYFRAENMKNIPTNALCFEAGQHDSPESVSRAIAAIVNCMRSIGMVDDHDVESKHDEILKRDVQGFPSVSDLFYVHRIQESDNFSMKPNFHNFDKIKKGQAIATDKRGEIVAPKDSYILMPLYQKQGEEGFFLVEEIE